MRRRFTAACCSGTYLGWPTQISGLQLWLKADAGLYQTAGGSAATLDGDPVGQWQDQSGNANHVSQATAGKRPTLKLAIQNGLPVVRFDGVDDILATTATIIANMSYASTITVAVVLASKDTAQRDRCWNLGRGNAGDFAYCTQMGTPTWSTNQSKWSTDFLKVNIYGQVITDAAALADNVFKLETAILTGGVATMRLNGTTSGTPLTADATIQGATTNNAIFQLGAGSDAGGTDCAYCDVAELCIYNSALSGSDLTTLETYLNSRWAIY